ncbi:MAG TPA: hypothetical protein P5509_10015 [Bacteroidales bacterium]|nr:hypothetical protein [Bacteroidales bacterium]
MKKHNGMRPQDVLVLLKIIAIGNDNWFNSDLSKSLHISASEITEALNRCKIAGLIDSKKRIVHINSFKEFLIYGLKYVFPAEPGTMVKGIPTAHSAPPINQYISEGKDIYVWPFAKGTMRGQAIEPLYRTLPAVALEDQKLYELLSIVDTIRVGRAREIKIAKEELEKRLKYAK